MNIWINILLIIFIGIIIILFIFLLQHQIQCNSIYNQEVNFTKKYIVNHVLTPNQCKQVMNEAENYALINKWSKTRHEYYPTTDNQITKEWSCYEFLEDKIKNTLYPLYQKYYNINANQLEIEELFIVKYDATSIQGQKSLEAHTDGSEFSFIIALNDEYEGGGTRFVENNEIVKCKKGDCVIFCGQTEHEGLSVHSGTRYILAGFIKFGFCIQQL